MSDLTCNVADGKYTVILEGGRLYALRNGEPWQELLGNKLVLCLAQELEEARGWVKDLHSGMYINCVYCGHRYGPSESTPASMADVLKAHVEQCPKHPMSALRAIAQRLLGLVPPPQCAHGFEGQDTFFPCGKCEECKARAEMKEAVG